MKLAFISDIHSNFEALKTVLDFISKENAKQIYCTGDTIGYNYQPNECLDALREAKVVSVKGNHEDMALGLLDMGNYTHRARNAIYSQKKILKKDNISFIKKLPTELVLDDYSMRLTHGSPYKPEEFHYVLSERDVVEAFKAFKEKVCLMGHTHMPTAYRYDKKNKCFEELSGDEIRIEAGYRYLINVGSVGESRDDNPNACVYIYDTEEKVFKRTRVA
ncbi:MAG: metallophosphoesterase family protein [bacterium]